MSKIRVKKVIAKMVGKGGKSLTKAMVESGYSPAYAHTPSKLSNSKTFKELMDEFIPDSLITQRHNELANACSLSNYKFDLKISDKTIKALINDIPGCKCLYVSRDKYNATAYFTQPDQHSRKDAIDMGYKLKGVYAPEQIELTKRKYQDLSNAELVKLKQSLINYLTKK